MKKKLFQKVICLLLSATVLFGVIAVTAFADGGKRGTNRDTASSLDEMKDLVGVLSYDEYLESFGDDYAKGLDPIKVDLMGMISGDRGESNGVVANKSELCLDSFKEDQTNWKGFTESDWENSVYLPAEGSTTWAFRVPDGASSYYYIKIEYYSVLTDESSISSIERKLFIDGKAPFDEASYVKMDKNWIYTNYTVADPVKSDRADGTYTEYAQLEDGYYKYVIVVKDGMETVTSHKIAQDINGNSMAPAVTQSPAWNTYYCQDSTGYYQGYFRFYLRNGSHQITLEAEREPVIIKSIELVPYEPELNELKSYDEVKAEYAEKGYKPAGGKITTLQAEFPDMVSDSSVYATNDNTSVANYPSISKAQLYNVIGENSYSTVGQWAAYKFTVNETGLYKISMRYLQSALQGMYICRTVKLNGGIYGLENGTPTVPFAEAYDTQFNYSKEWQSSYIGDSAGNIFEFYFEEGTEYTLYLECSLGSLTKLIQRVENSMNVINDCYLRILQLTGPIPDENQSYDFLGIMPDALNALYAQATELMSVKEELEALCNLKDGAHTATLKTIAILLDTMGSNGGYDIPANLSTLKSYLGTLGTWINDSKKSTMFVDSISVVPAGANDEALKELPAAKAGFWQSLWFEITSFIYSFSTDYDAMGLTTVPDKDTPTIDVWLATGRDQSQIWRSMIDANGGFTGNTGTAVALKLVTAGTLLPSILSGKGPDIYIGLGAADVINYAIRDAVVGISGNDTRLTDEENAIFKNTYYTYKDENGKFIETTEKREGETALFESLSFDETVANNYVPAAMDTVTLLNVSYGVPQTMGFAMMFYRMDVLAELGQEVPETWDQLLAILPALQSNNMEIGVAYISALDFMMYQRGGNMWKYTDIPEYAGAKIDLDSDIALEAFQFVCGLYTNHSFPVSYDAANRFRTGEMPIIIGDYASIYNQLVVYATEINGLWEFCPLPGSEVTDEDGNVSVNYNSLANITATVMLHGCDQMLAAWQFLQWQTSADVQANYGNKMVALIGPSAKYESANVNAINNLSWTASEKAAIKDQMAHLSSIVNYPGSYIIARYMQFAFLDAVNDGAKPVDAMTSYINAINAEITRKREEFDLFTLEADEEPPEEYLNKAN